MPIRITCTQCGKAFSAWDDLVGKTVQCPKCQQKMVVPAANPVSPSERSGTVQRPSQGGGTGESSGRPVRSAADPATRPGTGKTFAQSSAGSQNRSDRADTPPTVTRPIAGPARRPTSSPPAKTGSASPPSGRTNSFARATDDLDDSEDLPVGCENCNAPMPPDEDLCDACGYHRILKKVLDLDGVRRSSTATGFERLVSPQLAEGETVTNLLLWLKIAGCFVLSLILFLLLGTTGLILAIVVCGGYFAYQWWRTTQAADEADSAEEPDVNRDPLSIFLWSTWLSWQRMVNWRSGTAPYPPLRALTLRDPQFTDNDLRECEEITQYEVLDLEGTGISDTGCNFLATQKQLRFIVLRRTQVTAAGAQRLQKALPDANIWF